MDTFANVHEYLIGFAILYCCILFFDTIFKSCMFYPYLSLLNQLGITIKPYEIKWCTTRLNKTFFTMGGFMPRLLKMWFNTGYYLAFIALFVSIVFLSLPIIRHLTLKMPSSNYTEPVVTVIPGVTTPFSHIKYIIPAVSISMIFHEFGHALAASREKVPLKNCGISLFMIFPITFVNFAHVKLNLCTHKQLLRIYCAGVWHNLVLVILGFLYIYSFPSLLYPGLKTGSGVTVLDIKKSSSLAYKGGFLHYDVVTSVNDCSVKDEMTWFTCLLKIQSSPQLGFCSSETFLRSYGKLSDCCTNSSSENLCFEYTDNAKEFVCLPARNVIDHATFCRNNTDCSEVCLTPYLSSSKEKLIRFERENMKSVLFVGSIEELFYSVKVSSWISRISFPSIEFIIYMENFVKYLAGISAGLIILNVVPCYYVDGGYIIEHIFELHLKNVWNRNYRNILVNRLKIIGCIFLSVNIILGMSDFIKNL